MDLALFQPQSLWTESAELKLGYIPGETIIKLPYTTRCLSLTLYQFSLLCYICIFSACRLMSWVTARASELNWFELSLHVCSWLPTRHRLPRWESGPKETDSEVSAQEKKRMTRVMTWWQHGLTHIFSYNLWGGDYKLWLRQPPCVLWGQILQSDSPNQLMCRPRTCGGSWPNLVSAKGKKTGVRIQSNGWCNRG